MNNYSIGFQRLSQLSPVQRQALNLQYINLPLCEIHQAQKKHMENMSEEKFKEAIEAQ